MRASLTPYRKKRDFKVTAEPRGHVVAPGKRLSFVIQKHAAKQLHYDFRLELGGTLKSWAVPKGPSLDPAVRRMAVHVEDHPLSYASFEGTIPKGQYGAGTVIVWDRGEWAPIGDPEAGFRAGKLKFDLHGEKLHGRWNLVRMKGRASERQDPWLLIKESDEEARPASEYDIVEEMPESVKKGKAKGKRGKGSRSLELPAAAKAAKMPLFLTPQLATLVDDAPAGEGWIYELKYDGYRIVARIDGRHGRGTSRQNMDVKLFTRNGNDWTARLRPLAEEIAALGLESAWLDGEIVVPDEAGRPRFQLLQRAFDNANTSDIVFFAFDLPFFAGHDLTRVPLIERRALLAGVLSKNESAHVRFSEHFEGPVKPLLDAACKQGLEGLIGKRANAPYTSTRSTSWVKIKCSQRQEFVIVGHTDPKGSRTGFGSLLLAIHDEKTGKLRYAGNVGTGFDEALLRSIKGKLEALATDKAPIEAPRGVKGHWVRPKLVAEVGFTEWTDDGRIRHPVFQGLRTDKEPEVIKREKPGTAGGDTKAGVKITNGDRVIDTSTGLTKLDLATFYDSIADHILPHLEGRPATLVRAPSGIQGQHFFQKHADTRQIPGVREFDARIWPDHEAMIEIATRQALVAAAQMNVVEFHTSNVTIGRSARTVAAASKPDRLIFDLDPGEGIDWPKLVEATALMKKMLDLLELESFLKTSGGKGLHVVVPIKPAGSWDTVKDFSEEVVVHMAATLPQLFVAKSGARNRVGRIFIDYLRNDPTSTAVAPYSTRARAGAPVAMPVAWDELSPELEPASFTVNTVPGIVRERRADPWAEIGTVRQRLPS